MPPTSRLTPIRAACSSALAWPMPWSRSHRSSSSMSRPPPSTRPAWRICSTSSGAWSPSVGCPCSCRATCSRRSSGCAIESGSSSAATSSPKGRSPTWHSAPATATWGSTTSTAGWPPRRRRHAMAGPTDWQRRRGPGWRVVMGKELAEGLTSLRFLILLGLLSLAAAGPVYAASGAIRDAAERASGAAAVFLALFTIGADPVPSFVGLVGFLAPLLGIAFGFDAINGERAQGTMPRLLSQPIHRDDVINGKVAAGLAVIATILVALTALVAGIGIIRLGITPSAEDVLRLIAWLVVSIVYVAFWLSFATLCSVAFRRAASSVLVSIGLWLGVTLFAEFLVSAVASFVAPAGANAATEDLVANAKWTQLLSQLSPSYLYQEATVVLFNPSIRTIGVLLPSQAEQLQTGGVPSPLSIDQSLLLVWPQIVAIVALTVISFAVAYVLFLRQEVRA